MSGPVLVVSTRTHAIRLAARGAPFDAAALMAASGCSSSTAQTVLGKMAAEGSLARVAHGFYARPGLIPQHTPRPGGNVQVAKALAEREEFARKLAAADAFLTSKEQWPGCDAPLPSARAAQLNERGSRRTA